MKRNSLAFMLLGIVACPAIVFADGAIIDLNPGTPFTLYTMDSNDGYAAGRGMVFTANDAIGVNGAQLFTDPPANGLNATMELYQVQTTVGNVLAGATLLQRCTGTLLGDLDFHGCKFEGIETLNPGDSYLVRTFYDEAAQQNWFYDFDPAFFGDPPVNIGAVTLIDGTSAGDTSNFVATPMALQVPEPTTLTLLALSGLAVVRRRR